MKSSGSGIGALRGVICVTPRGFSDRRHLNLDAIGASDDADGRLFS